MPRAAKKTSPKTEPVKVKDNAIRARAADPWRWAAFAGIKLQSGPFTHANHEYLADPLSDRHPRQYFKKGAQMGFTEKSVLKTLHGMIHKRYPAGCLHLFPTSDDVTDFSKARFNSLFDENPEQIGRFVENTDTASIKRINGAMLYLRGAKATRNIEGLRKTSSKLKSVPVDRLVYDERDEMDQDMVDLALERISHSSIQEIEELSTPTVPDYGIDKSYQLSDQRVWMLRCAHCNGETCLELEFPACLARKSDGSVLRICIHCGREIFPKDGRWISQRPDVKDAVGWWISQLNSMYVDPKTILDIYERLGQPGVISRQEFMNSKLATAYVEAENRLTKQDLERIMTADPMEISHPGPCAMGVDVGNYLHCVIGVKPNEQTRKVLYVGRHKTFNDLHDLAKRFGVQVAVIDGEPEKHKARDFQKSEPYQVYLCDYQEHQRGDVRWNLETGEVVGNRTEMLDRVHALVTGSTRATARLFELPRRSLEIDQYVTEMTNMVKVPIELPNDRGRIYIYKQLGPDHYRHATVYFDLACSRVDICRDRSGLSTPVRSPFQDVNYDPFSYSQDAYPRDQHDIFSR